MLNAIACTNGPGLLGSLLVGTSFAKSISYSLGIPLICVDHINAHALSHTINASKVDFPFISLVVSGGHTQIMYIESYDNIKILKMKVVKNINNEALYFSRSLIPYGDTSLYSRHICIYSYKPSVLKKIVHLQPTPHEISESLEQLRWLENGFKIKLKSTVYDSFSVDTKNDLEKARNLNL